MNAALAREFRWLRLWPRTIAARLSLILFSGLLAAHALSFGLLFYERYEASTSMLLTNVEHDVMVAVNMLDRSRPEERASMLPLLRRRTVEFLLEPGEEGGPLQSTIARDMTQRIGAALGPRYPITANAVSGTPERFQIHLRLKDGAPVTIAVEPSLMPVAKWLPYVLAAQLAVLLFCTWAAVRLATRPLARLARAADTLSPTGDGVRMQPGNTVEVAKAVHAFNAMQARIAQYMRERMEILASISHDLQTPITRMRLRAESMEASPEREKVIEDLMLMQHLVREGIAYARSAHGATEPMVRIDLDAFLESLVNDYRDIAEPVTLAGRTGVQIDTRLQALRRILANLVDNALKYADEADVQVDVDGDQARIRVRDRGPGIPEDELDKVMAPFYRLEASRNRDTGGTGLGLAIAQQLAQSIGATLTLRNREGGGLEARLSLPVDPKR
jgi:signal transduction histidine kinase